MILFAFSLLSKVSGSTLLPLAKPMVMDSVDDPNSKRQFQLEVTVTKLR